MPSFHTYPSFPTAQLRAAPGENTCQWALKSSWLSHEAVGGKNTQIQQTSTSSQAGYRWETTREETDSAKSSRLMEASTPPALETEAPLPLRSCHGGHQAEAHPSWLPLAILDFTTSSQVQTNTKATLEGTCRLQQIASHTKAGFLHLTPPYLLGTCLQCVGLMPS